MKTYPPNPFRIARKNHHPAQNHAGFTLVELLVVITIIVVLAGITFTATQRVRRSALKVTDMSNLRSLATAAMAAGGDNGGRLPAIHAGTDAKADTNSAPYYLIGATSLMTYGINKEACYIPRKGVVGGGPLYEWWDKFGLDSQTPTHYNYFANDAPTGKTPWFLK